MPVGEQAERRVTWNHFSFAPDSRHTLSVLSSWDFRLLGTPCGLWRSVHAGLVTPGEPFPASPEAGEVTTAGGAAVRRGADSQQETRPARRVIILFAPGAQFLAVTAGAARILPSPVGPHAGFPTMMAAPAPQRIDPQPAAEELRKALALRNPHIARTTLGAS